MSKGLRFTMVLTVLLGMSLAVLAPLRLRHLEQRELRSDFQHELDARAVDLERELHLNLEVLFAFKNLFIASRQVEKKEFHAAAEEAMARHPGIRALVWVPYIEAPQRAAFEASIRAEDPTFCLFELSAQGQPRVAPSRRAHYPILHVKTTFPQEPLIGLDLGGDPAFLRLLDDLPAQRSVLVAGHAGLTVWPQLNEGLLGILPVYEAHSPGAVNRRDRLRGVMVGLFDFATLLQRADWSDFRSLFMASLVNMDPIGGHTELFAYQQQPHSDRPADVSFARDLKLLGNMRWRLLALPTGGYFQSRRSVVPWMFVLAGLVVALALPLYMWLMARHTAAVEALVARRTRQLDEANRKLASLSLTDGLTGIANRRFFDDHLNQEWKRAQREGRPLSLVMVDIDHFKAYNDYYGHLAGDDCLQRVARTLETVVARPGDLVARYGGEEFALVLPDTDNGARILGERCRAAVADLQIPHQASPLLPVVTVSVGVATAIPRPGSTPEELIVRADQALYRAKLLGRNQVVTEPVGPYRHAEGAHDTGSV